MLLIAMVVAMAPARGTAPVIEGFLYNDAGRVVQHWSIDTAGVAEFTSFKAGDPATNIMETYQAQIGPEGYAAVEALVAPVRAKASVKALCGPRRVDGRHGVIEWNEAPQTYTIGRERCLFPRSDAAFPLSEQAGALIERWTRGGKLVAANWVGPPPMTPR